jgi:hypothetical protein
MAPSNPVYNLSFSCNGYIIRNNTYRAMRRLGIQAKAHNGIIENNTFHNTWGSAILLNNEPDWGSSGEGPLPENVIVRGNLAVNCCMYGYSTQRDYRAVINVVGKNAGEDATVGVRFPDEYHNKDLAGKDAEFLVTIHSIKKKELPEIDDEFAQDVSDFESLEEYKADIRKTMTEYLEKQSMDSFQDGLIAKIVENTQIDVPEAMINKQMDYDVSEFELMLAYQGIEPESYYGHENIARDDVRENMRERAVSEVRTQLVLRQIGKEESIEVTEEDYEDELRKIAGSSGKEYAEYRETVTEDYEKRIRSRLKTVKIREFIAAGAKRV